MTGQDDANGGNGKRDPAQGKFGFVVSLAWVRAIERHTVEGLRVDLELTRLSVIICLRNGYCLASKRRWSASSKCCEHNPIDKIGAQYKM